MNSLGLDVNDLIHLLTPFVAPAVTGLWLKYSPRIPGWIIPPLCVSLGVAGSMLAKAVIGTPGDPLMSLILSVAGIGVRELQNQTRKQFLPGTMTQEEKLKDVAEEKIEQRIDEKAKP